MNIRVKVEAMIKGKQNISVAAQTFHVTLLNEIK
jgi:hypothetical protein